jgi:DNA-binding NarL/FixJ family response regulator
VIVMDLHMPGLNGIEATRRVLQTSPHINVLVLTMLEDDASVFAAMRDPGG